MWYNNSVLLSINGRPYVVIQLPHVMFDFEISRWYDDNYDLPAGDATYTQLPAVVTIHTDDLRKCSRKKKSSQT